MKIRKIGIFGIKIRDKRLEQKVNTYLQVISKEDSDELKGIFEIELPPFFDEDVKACYIPEKKKIFLIKNKWYSENLYHEIGHHVHLKKPEKVNSTEPELECFADEYERRKTSEFCNIVYDSPSRNMQNQQGAK